MPDWLRISALAVLGAMCLCAGSSLLFASSVSKGRLVISKAEYRDRARDIWVGQMIGRLTGSEFGHKPASALSNTPFLHGDGYAKPDDYYNEMVALRAFDEYGIGTTMQRLGAQWLKNSAGSWGTSEQTLLLLKRGILAPDTGRAGHRATVNTFNSTTYKGPSVVTRLYNLIPVPKYEADNSYRKYLTI